MSCTECGYTVAPLDKDCPQCLAFEKRRVLKIEENATSASLPNVKVHSTKHDIVTEPLIPPIINSDSLSNLPVTKLNVARNTTKTIFNVLLLLIGIICIIGSIACFTRNSMTDMIATRIASMNDAGVIVDPIVVGLEKEVALIEDRERYYFGAMLLVLVVPCFIPFGLTFKSNWQRRYA